MARIALSTSSTLRTKMLIEESVLSATVTHDRPDRASSKVVGVLDGVIDDDLSVNDGSEDDNEC